MTRAAAVIGASGGIGAGLVDALRDEGAYDVVHALSRSAVGDGHLDFADEGSVRAAERSLHAATRAERRVVRR